MYMYNFIQVDVNMHTGTRHNIATGWGDAQAITSVRVLQHSIAVA